MQYFSITLTMLLIIIIIIFSFPKKIIKILEINGEKELLSVLFLLSFFILMGNMGIVGVVNSFGKHKNTIIESKIINSSNLSTKHIHPYIQINIDGEKVKIPFKYEEKGDTYRLKVYTGSLGVKYYKDKDFDNGINGVIK